MDFHKVDAALRRVGEILNRRPLVVRVGQDNQYYAITAEDLLMGRASEAPTQRIQPSGKPMKK